MKSSREGLSNLLGALPQLLGTRSRSTRRFGDLAHGLGKALVARRSLSDRTRFGGQLLQLPCTFFSSGGQTPQGLEFADRTRLTQQPDLLLAGLEFRLGSRGPLLDIAQRL